MPLRLPYFADEPVHGTWARLAIRNGFPDGPTLARRFGLTWHDCLMGRHGDLVAKLAVSNPRRCVSRKLVIDARARRVHLGQKSLSMTQWQPGRRRLCPACLEDDTRLAFEYGLPPQAVHHHRIAWDIAVVDTCPIHQVALMDACPVCAVPLDWVTGHLDRCANGHNLLTVPRSRSDPGVSAFLLGRLGLSHDSEAQILEGATFDEALRDLELLGQIERTRCARRLPHRSYESRVKARHVGLAIANDLSRHLSEVLDHSFNQADGPGLIASYGWVYTYWAYPDGRMVGAIKQALRRHAVLRGVIAAEERRLGHESVRASKGLVAFARDQNCGFATARRRLEESGYLSAGLRQGVGAIVRLSSLPKPLGRSDTVSTRGLAEHWKIGRRTVIELAHDRRLRQTGNGICARSVTKFEGRLSAQISYRPAPRSALGVCEVARAKNIALSRILGAIADGKIWAASPDPASYQLRLNKLVIMLDEIHGIVDRPISIEEASRRIGIHHDAARALVACGAIKRQNGRGLCRSSVKDFCAQHVPLADLAHARRKSPRSLKDELDLAGVLPAYDRPAYRQIIYRRADVSP